MTVKFAYTRENNGEKRVGNVKKRREEIESMKKKVSKKVEYILAIQWKDGGH